jgi:hypothetical protein
MSNHSQRQNEGASVATIASLGAGTLVSLMGTCWTASGALTVRELAGAVLGTALTVLLFGMTAIRAIDRVDRRDQIVRSAWRQEKRLAELAEWTGTWTGDTVGAVFTVRYDPGVGRFYTTGLQHWPLGEERVWLDVPYLVFVVGEKEACGYLPADDAGTRRVKAELGLWGPAYEWPLENADMTAAWPVPVDGEQADSQRIESEQRWAEVAQNLVIEAQEDVDRRFARDMAAGWMLGGGETPVAVGDPTPLQPSDEPLTALIPTVHADAEAYTWYEQDER